MTHFEKFSQFIAIFCPNYVYLKKARFHDWYNVFVKGQKVLDISKRMRYESIDDKENGEYLMGYREAVDRLKRSIRLYNKGRFHKEGFRV